MKNWALVVTTFFLVPAAASAAWEKQTTTDPMTDAIVSSALTQSLNQPEVALVVRTTTEKGKQPRVEVYVSTHTYFGKGGLRAQGLQWRFDDEKPQNNPTFSRPWVFGTDGTSLFAPKAEEFLLKIRAAHKLVVKAEDFQHTSYTFEFNVAGFDDAK